MARTSTTEGLTSTNSQADQSSEKPKKSLRALLDLFTEAQQLPSAERETVLLSRCNVSNACERKQVARLFWSSMTSPDSSSDSNVFAHNSSFSNTSSSPLASL